MAALIDPQRDTQAYEADAEAAGLRIAHVFLSHFHADFIAGHLELRDRHGTVIHLGSRAEAEYDFVFDRTVSEDKPHAESVRIVTADQPDAPDYFTYDAILNTKEHPTLEHTLERGLRPLEVDEAVRLGEQGEQILDVRETAEFAGAEAATRLGRIGFDEVLAYVASGMGALVLDVRNPGEFAEEHVAGGRNEPLNRLPSRTAELAAGGGPIVVHCASGYRSSIAASLLTSTQPAADVHDLVGGLEAWKAAGLPVESGAS